MKKLRIATLVCVMLLVAIPVLAQDRVPLEVQDFRAGVILLKTLPATAALGARPDMNHPAFREWHEHIEAWIAEDEEVSVRVLYNLCLAAYFLRTGQTVTAEVTMEHVITNKDFREMVVRFQYFVTPT